MVCLSTVSEVHLLVIYLLRPYVTCLARSSEEAGWDLETDALSSRFISVIFFLGSMKKP